MFHLNNIIRTSFLIIAFILPTTSHADSVNDLQKYLNETKSLSANFNQTVRSKSGKTENSSGQFYLIRPGKFKWIYKQPYNQEITSNGQQLWLYDIDLAQVTIKPINKALDASPAAILTGNNNLAQNFNLQSLPTKDGANWVALTPKSKDGSFAQIRIGLVNGAIDRMELDDHFNQTTMISFNKVQKNAPISAQMFTFTPPAGVDVIRE
ncbi:outer membrane lipoprotein chaperone LolA [Chitinibacter bivalviorum]|uniref:Outer-membrane lipoprotein carrier protein n=1 Tax=Chitinibacter bivalviorum TaxID=2739434 RepID=A0A7H9BHZ2_9NEIS|nr:outer membrane lipoprotein chaperone LolA [Chitinibacter bivalviorum]QLG88159.1 outer membrane lipoprotein chaperone LolA [Chitinibacter bivalviorum]